MPSTHSVYLFKNCCKIKICVSIIKIKICDMYKFFLNTSLYGEEPLL